MNFKAPILAVSLLVTLSTSSAHAFYPVVDAANIAQAIKQVEAMTMDQILQNDMLANAYKQFEMLKNQYVQLQSIYGSFTGIRANIPEMLLPRLNDILQGNFSTANGGGVLSTLMGGAGGGWDGFNSDKNNALSNTANKSLKAAGLSPDILKQWTDSREPIQQRTAQQASGGAMLAATAEQSYKESGESLKRVKTILDASKNSKDIKESIDNNTRMLAELSIQLAKSLEITSTEAVFNGQSGVNEAAERAEERKFFTFGNGQQ